MAKQSKLKGDISEAKRYLIRKKYYQKKIVGIDTRLAQLEAQCCSDSSASKSKITVNKVSKINKNIIGSDEASMQRKYVSEQNELIKLMQTMEVEEDPMYDEPEPEALPIPTPSSLKTIDSDEIKEFEELIEDMVISF